MPFTLLLTLLLCLAGCAPAPWHPPGVPAGATGIAGQVLDAAGAPTAGAFVDVYRNSRRGLRGPADFEARTDAQGRYFLDLVKGRYYLVARRRTGGGDAGPPRPGDAWASYGQNPVTVRQGRVSRADFTLFGVSGAMLLGRRGGSLTGGDTGFTGKVVDAQGHPVAGAIVLAYRNADYRRMPDYTSPQVDAGGRFHLYVPASGRYCLAARTGRRGPPKAGEPYGVLGKGKKGCRQVARGEILDVGSIVLHPFGR